MSTDDPQALYPLTHRQAVTLHAIIDIQREQQGVGATFRQLTKRMRSRDGREATLSNVARIAHVLETLGYLRPINGARHALRLSPAGAAYIRKNVDDFACPNCGHRRNGGAQ